MSNFKDHRYADRTAAGYEGRLARVSGTASNAANGSNGNDVGSLDAYRNWLTKVQAPDQRRALPDEALFSWKGYRSWAEKVRRDWESES